jgi:DNA-binding LacI/PurR family transcriptional regulator
MTATIKTIAKLAGVSHSTVSRALNGDPRITPETIARIVRIAGEVGYTPNRAGRSLKTKRTYTLGFAVDSLANPVHAEFLRGIEECLQGSDYSLLFAITRGRADAEARAMQTFAEHGVDGILICPSTVSPAVRRFLDETHIPVVLIHPLVDTDYRYTVMHDDWFGGYAATQYLIAQGHRQIGYLGILDINRMNENRRAGYLSAMHDAGLSVSEGMIQAVQDGILSGSAGALRRWLDNPSQRPTAIFCYDDLLAIGAMRALKDSALPVPGAISVVGFDNIEMTAYTDPELTTFAQPKFEMGYRAAEMLLALLEKREGIEAPLTLRGQLIERASVSPFAG